MDGLYKADTVINNPARWRRQRAFPKTMAHKDMGNPRGSSLVLSRAQIRLLGFSGRVLA